MEHPEVPTCEKKKKKQTKGRKFEKDRRATYRVKTELRERENKEHYKKDRDNINTKLFALTLKYVGEYFYPFATNL